MFDSTLNPLWQRYILAVQEEVKPALGCTEPISLALAAAVAAAELEGPVERVEARVSPNLMKNGLGVTVRHGNGGAADCGGAGGVRWKCQRRAGSAERRNSAGNCRCQSTAGGGESLR